MLVVISYDISEQYSRNKISKILAGYGERVQKSVFECHINNQQLKNIQDSIEKIIHPETDNVRYYKLCLSCNSQAAANGNQDITIIPPAFVY